VSIDNHRGEGVQIGDGVTIADPGALASALFGESVDALTAGTLVVKGTEEGSIAIERNALDASQFPVDIFDAAFALRELLVLAGLAGLLREEQRALEALSLRAVGVIELDGGMHGQADGTTRSAISQASKGYLGSLSEGDSGDASMASGSFLSIPGIRGGIPDEVGGELIEGKSGLAVKWAEKRDVVFVERLSVFGQDNGSILGNDGGSNTSARAPDEFFLLFRGAIGLLLVGAALDAETAIRSTFGHASFVVTIFDGGALIVLLNPGVDVFDIEGDGFTQAGNLLL
jgi:hypothetical protein